jgi:hypothetical protein
VVALACNLDLLGTGFLAGWTAVFVSGLHRTPAGQVRTFVLLTRRGHWFSLVQTLPERKTFRRPILLLARLPVCWLLFSLQLLLFLLVSLLQLLRLLLMALFHLLPLRVIHFLFIHLHVFLVLLLLELVSLLLLLRALLVLLLLVLPVPLRVARIGSVPCRGRKVARMDGRAGLSGVVL